MMEEKKGDCFPAAFKFLLQVAAHDLDGKEFVLVHGNIARLPQDDEVNHAWVEEGNIVHEVSNGRHSRAVKDEYYAHFHVTNTRCYSVSEAMKRGVVHMGPWDN